MSIQATADGTRVSIQPKVVDAGHHQRRLLRLTGLDVEENQARRLLNDLDEFRARISRLGDDEEMAAHEWLTRVFEPVVKAIPFDLRAKLEPAEVFHQVLEHRWYMSQARGTLGAARRGAHELHRRRAPPPPRRGDADVAATETMSLPVITAEHAGAGRRRRRQRRLARPGLKRPDASYRFRRPASGVSAAVVRLRRAGGGSRSVARTPRATARRARRRARGDRPTASPS